MVDQCHRLWATRGQVLGVPVGPWSPSQDAVFLNWPGNALKVRMLCLPIFQQHWTCSKCMFSFSLLGFTSHWKMYYFTGLTRERNIVFYSIYVNKDGENCLQHELEKLSCGLQSSSVITATNTGSEDLFPSKENLSLSARGRKKWVKVKVSG